MPRGIPCEARGPRRDALLHAMLCANDTIARRTGGNKPRPAIAYYGYSYSSYYYYGAQEGISRALPSLIIVIAITVILILLILTLAHRG
jgi:hypothetical protein